MKNLIFFFFLFSFSFCNAQSLSIKGFLGSAETVEYTINSTQSDLDSNYHFLSTATQNIPVFRPAVSINFTNGEFLEISAIRLVKSGIAFPFGTIRVDESVGRTKSKFSEISFDYYFKINSLQSEKLKIFWSPGLSIFEQEGIINPASGSSIYRFARQDFGFILKFLTRFKYDLPVAAWKIEGGFGINAFDYRFQRIEERGRKSKKSLVELNDHLSAFARIGMSYTFDMKRNN